jgi:hypothetical protein
MITLDAPDFFGYALFADDIRVEASGKFIYIGVYTTQMTHAAFPVVLPKLVININYSQLPDEFIPPRFWVFLPGDRPDTPSIQMEMPEESSREAIEKAKQSPLSIVGADKVYANANANFTFNGLPIAEPGLIRVRAARGDKLVRLGSLSIVAGDIPTQ